MVNVLDLFSGIGGFSLGLERAGMTTKAFCEIDPYCRRVLKKHWPDTPIHTDIRSIRDEFTGAVDLICGGYPCQPFSVAGERKGAHDDRHLWPEMLACIRQYRPTWLIGENVAGHVSLGLDDVLSDLENEGYTTRPFIIPACAVGAPHRRDRVWIIAYTGGQRISGSIPKTVRWQSGFSWCKDIRRPQDYFHRSDIPEPLVRRLDNGVSRGVDRLRAIGNAVVPQVVEVIGRAIMQNYV